MMPLLSSKLQTELTPLFTTPPDNIDGCAAAWGNAMKVYAADIFPPSLNVTLAATALEADLKGIFKDNSMKSMLAELETAFVKFATSVGTGMLPTYTVTVLPAKVGFEDLKQAATVSAGVSNFVSIIDTWMKTGQSKLSVYPSTIEKWV